MNVYVIAEIGINHNGDINIAKELILKAAKADCNAVKFQKRTIDLVYTQEELDAYRESPWGTTNREQKEGLEFSIEQMAELEKYATSFGLDFVVSCWDTHSVAEVWRHLHVEYHKVASALITDRDLLDAINETQTPVIVSSGMSTSVEVNRAVEYLKRTEAVLACTSTYPTPPDEINLRYITALKEIYPELKVGFSNHYSGGLACYGAVALGAEMVEFHITLDRTMYGSDQSASIEHVDVVVDGIRRMEKMMGDGFKVIYDSEIPAQRKLRKNKTL